MGRGKEEMKTLYEELDEEEKSSFDNARRTVIREMEAIKEHDAESCVIYLIDAIGQISKLQIFALHKESEQQLIEGEKAKPFTPESASQKRGFEDSTVILKEERERVTKETEEKENKQFEKLYELIKNLTEIIGRVEKKKKRGGTKIRND